MYFPRPSRLIAGFVLAGLVGLAVYFLPLFQSASTATVSTGPLPIQAPNPLPTTTDPFTVLLLGSDDDSKFPQDRVNTQSMILVRVDPKAKPAVPAGPFQLWTVAPSAASASAPRQITTRLDLDPTSAPAWTFS
jgi:hypothetical protein